MHVNIHSSGGYPLSGSLRHLNSYVTATVYSHVLSGTMRKPQKSGTNSQSGKQTDPRLSPVKNA
jgi:hypothetical protein